MYCNFRLGVVCKWSQSLDIRSSLADRLCIFPEASKLLLLPPKKRLKMLRKKFAQKLTGSAFHFLLLLSLGEGQVGHALFSLVLPPPLRCRDANTQPHLIFTQQILKFASREKSPLPHLLFFFCFDGFERGMYADYCALCVPYALLI